MLHVLKRIQDDTSGPQQHGWLTKEEFGEVGNHFQTPPTDIFQIDSTRRNEAGALAARLTPRGVSFLPKEPVQSKYVVEDGVPMPKVLSGRGSGLVPRKSEYPFETMHVGQSFLAVKKNADDEPVRRLSSIVSATNRRMHPKFFRVFPDASPDGRLLSDGARVFRVDDAIGPLPEVKKRTPKAKGGEVLPAAAPPTGGNFTGAQTPFPAHGGGFPGASAHGFGGPIEERQAAEPDFGSAPVPFGFGGDPE